MHKTDGFHKMDPLSFKNKVLDNVAKYLEMHLEDVPTQFSGVNKWKTMVKNCGVDLDYDNLFLKVASDLLHRKIILISATSENIDQITPKKFFSKPPIHLLVFYGNKERQRPNTFQSVLKLPSCPLAQESIQDACAQNLDEEDNIYNLAQEVSEDDILGHERDNPRPNIKIGTMTYAMKEKIKRIQSRKCEFISVEDEEFKGSCVPIAVMIATWLRKSALYDFSKQYRNTNTCWPRHEKQKKKRRGKGENKKKKPGYVKKPDDFVTIEPKLFEEYGYGLKARQMKSLKNVHVQGKDRDREGAKTYIRKELKRLSESKRFKDIDLYKPQSLEDVLPLLG